MIVLFQLHTKIGENSFRKQRRKSTIQSKGGSIALQLLRYLSQALSIYESQVPSIVLRTRNIQCSFLRCNICTLVKSALDMASAFNWRLYESQQMTEPIQLCQCMFSRRCSYVLLDPAGLKHCLEEKYTALSSMVRSQKCSYLDCVLLLFFFLKGQACSQKPYLTVTQT